MSEITFLYRLTAPDGKIYIGMTNNVLRRWAQHEVRDRNTDLSRSIRKHGWAKFKKEVIVRGSREFVSDFERQAIEALGCMAPHGLNCIPGGDLTPEEMKRRNEIMLSTEVRAKISKSLKSQLSEIVAKGRARFGNREYHLDDGRVFFSQSEVAKALGVEGRRISLAISRGTRCRGRRITVKRSTEGR